MLGKLAESLSWAGIFSGRTKWSLWSLSPGESWKTLDPSLPWGSRNKSITAKGRDTFASCLVSTVGSKVSEAEGWRKLLRSRRGEGWGSCSAFSAVRGSRGWGFITNLIFLLLVLCQMEGNSSWPLFLQLWARLSCSAGHLCADSPRQGDVAGGAFVSCGREAPYQCPLCHPNVLLWMEL